MGPILLFDKSFLQSLTVDESVWLDAFFVTNICPMFYVETLADIGKTGAKGRNSLDEVRKIAGKFPQINSGPCAYHLDLVISSLLGYDIPQTGQVPLAESRLVEVDGKLGVVSEESPVASAFARWQNGRFLEIEKDFSKVWRDAIKSANISSEAHILEKLGINLKSSKDLEEIYQSANSLVQSSLSEESLGYFLDLISVPTVDRPTIIERWNNVGKPTIQQFAPYAAFVAKIETFYVISCSAGLAYTERPSTKIDVAYMYYLPFCMVFTSSDKFHLHSAPLFLRPNQDFIWGSELKEALRWLNSYFSSLLDSEKARGVQSMSSNLPKGSPEVLVRLWDKHLPRWREFPSRRTDSGEQILRKIIEISKKMESAPTFNTEPESYKVKDLQLSLNKRKVRKKRGSWNIYP
jgi:hypothetical protein